MANSVAVGGTLFMVGHRPIDPATGAATAAAGQVQVSVESAVAALDPSRWEVLVAEERARRVARSGVDAVIRAQRLVHRLSERGESRWLLELQPDWPEFLAQLFNTAMVVDDAGTVWIVGPSYHQVDPDPPPSEPWTDRFWMYEIAADGSRCIAHDVPDEFPFNGLAAAPDGGLYFLGQFGIGLLRPD